MRKISLCILICMITFAAQAQIGKWTQACYYDIDNKKICGEIKWDLPVRGSIFKSKGDYIEFRNSDTVKKQKIHTDNFRSFILKTDSFVVSRNIMFKYDPILMVMLNNPTKLYVSIRENQAPMMMGPTGLAGLSLGLGMASKNRRYFYGDDPDNVTELSRATFVDAMSKVMADNAGLVQAIKNKEYRYGDLKELIKQYQIFKEHPLE